MILYTVFSCISARIHYLQYKAVVIFFTVDKQMDDSILFIILTNTTIYLSSDPVRLLRYFWRTCPVLSDTRMHFRID